MCILYTIRYRAQKKTLYKKEIMKIEELRYLHIKNN